MNQPHDLYRPYGSRLTTQRVLWGAILFLAGFSAGLFSIVIYHIFAFFNLSWLFFANLLFIGFPLGGYIYLRFIDGKPNAFVRSLTYLFLWMLISSFFFVLLKYPTMWWTVGVWSGRVLLSMGVISIVSVLPFLGFFICYGMVEVAGYRKGQELFENRIYVIYSLYLFGLAIGYVLVSLTLERVGLFRILLIPFIVWGITCLLLKGALKKTAFVTIVVCLVLLIIPGTGRIFFNLIQPPFLILGLRKVEIGPENRMIYEKWDRASHLTLIDTGESLHGAYDCTFLLWGFERESPAYKEGDHRTAAFRMLPEQPDILIIGSGGGRDVAHALTYKPRSIVAVEVRESVIKALRGPFSDKVNNVYNHPSVTAVIMDGRKYLENTPRKFDLVYLPYVDTLMINTKTIFDASELIHTHDSFMEIKKHLKPGGIIAIARNLPFDPKLRLFKQYFNSFYELGLFPIGLFDKDRYLLLGFNIDSEKDRPAIDQLSHLNVQTVVTERGNIDRSLVRDDKPYMAGIPAAVIPIRSIKIMLMSQLMVFIIISSAFALPLSTRSAMTRWPIQSKNLIMVGGVLVGTNFLAMEYHLIFVLLRNLEQPFDAIFIGTILFLFITGLGSIATRSRSWKIETLLAVFGLMGSVATYQRFPDTWHLVLLIPSAYMTGRFFPIVFGTTKGRMLRVFAMDSVGAFMATILAGFIPILLGYTAYFLVVMFVFVLTLVLVMSVRSVPE